MREASSTKIADAQVFDAAAIAHIKTNPNRPMEIFNVGIRGTR